MYEGGDILEVKCEDCGQSFPAFTFTADTDMVTHGCVALTGTQRKDIVLTMMRPGETAEDINRRIGLSYKIVDIEREQARNKATASFQDFLKTYQPAKAIYKCIYCCNGHGMAIKGESKCEFMAHGTIEVRDAS